MKMNKTTYRIHETVVEDTHAFPREVAKFLAGEASPVAFRAVRVPMGIYEQRKSGTYMVRIRLAGGVCLPHQAKRVAELAEEFGNGIVHITTRQDMQLHDVLVQSTPVVLERLLEVGLSPRGGGGNTTRNVTACLLAGVCPDEAFDVTPYAITLTEHLLANRANFNLPRKFKTAFSGCGKDCALCSVADLGFFAHTREGVQGFSVYAGGGMGAHSALGIEIEKFVPAPAIFEVTEAVKRLFDQHGDRVNRHQARLRFVVERMGPDEFRRLYRQELAQVRREGISVPEIRVGENGAAPAGSMPADEPDDPGYRLWQARHVFPQKQAGLCAVRIPLSLGDIRARELSALAELAVVVGDGALRATQDQDLYLRGVPGASLYELYRALRESDERLIAIPSIRSVVCAGASTCKLGLCLSRGLAQAVEAELRGLDAAFDEPIRINGCPNSCGRHPIAPIGLQGGAVRTNGRLVPVYSIMVGGRAAEGNAALARFVAKVPAKAVPALLREFWSAAATNRQDGETLDNLIDRWGADYLRTLAAKYAHVPSYEEAPEFYRDFGCDEDFSLAGRGPGECGAGVMDVIALDIDEAKTALAQNALYDAVVMTTRALLITRGLEPKKDREIFAAFSEHFITSRWVGPRAQLVLDAALDLRLGDRNTLEDLRDEIRALLSRVEELFRSLDSNLQFRVKPVELPAVQESAHSLRVAQELDLRGVVCPMNFVRAKIQLEQIETGQVLDVLLDDGEPVRNVPASLAQQGQEVLSVAREGGHFRVRVRKVE